MLALKIIKNVDKYREAAKLEVKLKIKSNNFNIKTFLGECAGKVARKRPSGKTVSIQNI